MAGTGRHRAILVGLLAMTCLLAGSAAAWAGPVSLEATMILASNEPAAQDQRLDAVEYKLRRIFGFEYYRYYGGGSAIVNLPGDTTISLGHGYRLSISAGSKDGRVRAGIRWLRGDEVVLNTTVNMERGTPVILGGIAHEGGTLIVTLTAK
ncbi:MAG: hypothetical protein V1873_05410 [Verrucomicrobiota bacterium]